VKSSNFPETRDACFFLKKKRPEKDYDLTTMDRDDTKVAMNEWKGHFYPQI
jgi:hypothetical protein